MKIAAHTMGTPEFNLAEAIELFASLGFDGMEIIWDDDYRCAIRKSTPFSQLSKLKMRLKDRNLSVCCLTPYMSEINSLDSKIRQQNLDDFKRCIDTAGILKSNYIRVYGGKYFPDCDQSKRRALEQTLIESLKILGEYASRVGVILAVETHFNTLTWKASETAKIIRQVGSPSVGVLYDQPNLEFSEGENYIEALRILEGLIAMVHVKDLVYKKGIFSKFISSKVETVDASLREVSSRIPGDGIIPWPEIITILKNQGFEGWLSLEYERRWFPDDLPPAKEGMKKGLEYMRMLLKNLNVV